MAGTAPGAHAVGAAGRTVAGSRPVVHRYTSSVLDWHVNLFLVETANGVVLIDGAIAVSSAAEVRALIDDKIGKPLIAVLLTHGHPDHYTGVGEIVAGRSVPVLATQGTVEVIELRERTEAKGMATAFGDEYPTHKVFPNQIVKEGDRLAFDGVEFTVRDYGPCESDADALWLTTLNGTRHVFAGDLVYNHMHSFMRDGHALAWLDRIEDALAAYDHRTVFHPGHGDDYGTELLHWQRAYIRAFLAALKDLLGDRLTLDDAGRQTLVRRMQSFLPNDKLMFLMTFELDQAIDLLRQNGAI